MISIYVYNKNTRQFLYCDSGAEGDVVRDSENDKDFTLTPPPNGDCIWYWIDDKWTTDNTAN